MKTILGLLFLLSLSTSNADELLGTIKKEILKSGISFYAYEVNSLPHQDFETFSSDKINCITSQLKEIKIFKNKLPSKNKLMITLDLMSTYTYTPEYLGGASFSSLGNKTLHLRVNLKYNDARNRCLYNKSELIEGAYDKYNKDSVQPLTDLENVVKDFSN